MHVYDSFIVNNNSFYIICDELDYILCIINKINDEYEYYIKKTTLDVCDFIKNDTRLHVSFYTIRTGYYEETIKHHCAMQYHESLTDFKGKVLYPSIVSDSDDNKECLIKCVEDYDYTSNLMK